MNLRNASDLVNRVGVSATELLGRPNAGRSTKISSATTASKSVTRAAENQMSHPVTTGEVVGTCQTGLPDRSSASARSVREKAYAMHHFMHTL